MQKTGHLTLTGDAENLSGMRIGGSDELLDIGGVDLTCIKHPITRNPYLPGSSLKGRARCELERRHAKLKDKTEPCGCAKAECLVCRLFGPHKNTSHQLGPTRLIFRDATCVKGGDIEIVAQTMADRQTGGAARGTLRQFERVAAGSLFAFRIDIQVYDLDQSCEYKGQKYERAMLEFLKDGLREVQNTGLGSGVSRGSGQIEFKNLKVNGIMYACGSVAERAVSEEVKL
jgi:CRISPR-associated protein Csm3